MFRYVAAAAALFTAGALADHLGWLPIDAIRSLKATVVQQPDPRQQRSAQFSARLELFSMLPGTADVVMLGDSITQFGDWHELFPNIQVINRGIVGDTSDGVLARLDEVRSRTPRLVFLMIGINDLGLGIPPEVTANNIKAIKSRLERVGSSVVVQSVLLTRDQATNRKVSQINSLISPDVDLNPSLAPDGMLVPSYTWDGVHLNGGAYLKWRDEIAPIVSRP